MRSWQHTFLSRLQQKSFQHQPHKQDFGCYLSTSLTYHITFLSTQCMFSPHAGLHHPLVDKLCKYHLLCLYIVRRWCRQNTKRIQLLMTWCSGETALYAIRRWTLMLYSKRMDRDHNPGQLTELCQVAWPVWLFENWYFWLKFWQPIFCKWNSNFKVF